MDTGIIITGNVIKSCFPFRLGTTSYIIPDDIEPNVRHLAPLVDDIEIVLFESEDYSNVPTGKLVSRLADMAAEHNLTYTIHLPLDTSLGHQDERIRRTSVDRCRRIIECMSPVNPFAYILHLQGDIVGNPPSQDMDRWLSQHRRSIEELLMALHPDKLCVETLSYPYHLIEEVVDDYSLSICLDIGHILLYGYSLQSYLDHYLHRTHVVHLHGIRDGKDHTDIACLESDIITLLIDRLNRDMLPRVMTLEIFSERELFKSLDIMRRYIK